MASTNTPARPAAFASQASAAQNWATIGVGIDTARYGHVVSFLRPDRQPAANKLLVMENQASYQALRQRLEQLHQQHPQAHFHIRIDAAGQYANNLECFLRGLPLPMTLSIGEPQRNLDYQKAHFPKRQTDETESIAMARFAVVEEPAATAAVPQEMALLATVAGRLQAQTRQTTQSINRLHNLLARVFPELASYANNFAAAWVLELLDQYPSAAKIANAHLTSLQKITYFPQAKAQALHQAAGQSVASLRGAVAETLVRELVDEVRHSQRAESKLRQLLIKTYRTLPAGNHGHLTSIAGIGDATAAVLTAKIINIDRFASPDSLVGYFGVFPEEHSSGVDKNGRPLPAGTQVMSPRGNDLVRAYLWMASLSGIRANPALRALYRRLRAKGKRGDVAMGHCMRKLLHLVWAVWKTGKPFDPNHFPWIPEGDTPTTPTPATPGPAAVTPADTPATPTEAAVTPGDTPAALPPVTDRAAAIVAPTPVTVTPAVLTPVAQPAAAPAPATPTLAAEGSVLAVAGNQKAVGHKRDQVPAKQVVTTAPSSVKAAPAQVNPALAPTTLSGRPLVDFAFVREQITIAQVLQYLGIMNLFRGNAQQRRGPCPVHAESPSTMPTKKHTCSVHLQKNVFHCFQADCAAQGNVLDFWAAVHRLPLYEAALHLAATFQIPCNREEAPVFSAQHLSATTGSNAADITENGG